MYESSDRLAYSMIENLDLNRQTVLRQALSHPRKNRGLVFFAINFEEVYPADFVEEAVETSRADGDAHRSGPSSMVPSSEAE